MSDSVNMVSNQKFLKAEGGQLEKGNVTYIMRRNSATSSSVKTIERADIAVNVQHCASDAGTLNLGGRCEIVAISVAGA
jgi:hypothetical protein